MTFPLLLRRRSVIVLAVVFAIWMGTDSKCKLDELLPDYDRTAIPVAEGR